MFRGVLFEMTVYICQISNSSSSTFIINKFPKYVITTIQTRCQRHIYQLRGPWNIFTYLTICIISLYTIPPITHHKIVPTTMTFWYSVFTTLHQELNDELLYLCIPLEGSYNSFPYNSRYVIWVLTRPQISIYSEPTNSHFNGQHWSYILISYIMLQWSMLLFSRQFHCYINWKQWDNDKETSYSSLMFSIIKHAIQ